MLADVEFADGTTCQLKLIYNWDRMHMYESEDAYLLVPYRDVIKGVVPMEEFLQAQKEAKHGPDIGESDIGKVLSTRTAEKKVCKINWKEVGSSS